MAAHTQIQAKLEQAGIGFESIRVFGAARCNVHILCVSRDTADKWAILLNKVFTGSTAKVVSTAWDAAENKGTCLNHTVCKGYLIGIAA